MRINKVKTTAVFFVLFGILVMALVPVGIEEGSGAFGPRLFPRVVSLLMIVSGAGTFLKEMLFKKEAQYVELAKGEIPKVLLMLALMAVFIFLMGTIGFLPSALVFAVSSQIFYGVKDWRYYAVTVALVLMIYVVFEYLLKVALP